MNNAGKAMKPEASTLSKSLSVSNTGEAHQRDLIVSGKYSLIDRSFPLFDEMMKFTRIPPIFYFILILFHQMQTVVTSLWAGLDIHNYEGLPGAIVKWISIVAYFNDLSEDRNIQLAGFVVMTIVILVLVFSLPRMH